MPLLSPKISLFQNETNGPNRAVCYYLNHNRIVYRRDAEHVRIMCLRRRKRLLRFFDSTGKLWLEYI